MSEKEVKKLWQQYKKNNSPELKDKLIIHYASLVKYIAGRLNMYLGQNVEYDDLVSYGIFGLIDAIDKFDLTKNIKFETYASLRIRGSIIDHMRKMDWVPRSIRQKQKTLERAYTELEHKNGRPATDDEIMKYLDISEQDFLKLLDEANINSLMSLEQYIDQGKTPTQGNAQSPMEHPENYIAKLEVKETLKSSISNLPPREAKVITLYYFEELTLREISVIMEVSESRISQLHTKALSRLKGKLGEKRRDNID